MRSCDLSQNHEGAPARLFEKFMDGPRLAAIKAELNLSSNDRDKDEGATTSDAVVTNYMLEHNATDIIMAKAGEENPSFSYWSLTARDSSQKVCDLTLTERSVYSYQTLRVLFFQKIDLSIGCNMLHR